MPIKRITSLLVVACSLLLGPHVVAQSGNFSMMAWNFGNGGGQSGDNRFVLVGTVGQFNTANPTSNNNFTVTGGFWSAPLLVPDGTGAVPSRVLLPVIIHPFPTPIPQATWQRVGGNGMVVAAVATQKGQLFAGIRDTTPGGLFKKSLASCDATPPLVRVDAVNPSTTVLNIVFKDGLGLIANYGEQGEKLFYSPDGGASWQPANTVINNVQTVAIGNTTAFYAGTLEKGIYRSTNTGLNWKQQTTTPANINALKVDTLDQSLLWIATDGGGVWTVRIDLNNRTTEANSGLTGASRTVWDFAFDQANNIYIATFNGVFKWDGAAWQSFNLTGKKVYSLEIVNDLLYAGTKQEGVWRRPLNASRDWEQVSSAGWNNQATINDLFYDAQACHGLLAGTNDGVWIYR